MQRSRRGRRCLPGRGTRRTNSHVTSVVSFLAGGNRTGQWAQSDRACGVIRTSTLVNSCRSAAVSFGGPCGWAAKMRSPLRITRESERELSQFGATESCQFTPVYGCSKNTRSTATFCHYSRYGSGSPTRSTRSASPTAVEGSELICVLSGDSKTSWQYSPQNCHSRSRLLFTICGPRQAGHRPHGEAGHRGGERDKARSNQSGVWISGNFVGTGREGNNADAYKVRGSGQ